MGLGGRKVKQRIGADPRNLTWADDAAKFGQAYLTKLGWDPSRGLGASGEGRTSHIKVAQKLNMLGIGAGSKNGMGDETVAWKQSRDYELLLKRLNEESGKVDQREADTTEEKEAVEENASTTKKRKRDGDSDVVVGDSDKEKKKRKKEKKVKKEKRKKEKDEGDKSEGKPKKEMRETKEDTPAEMVESTSTNTTIQAPIPRPMAHRARFLRSKQLASRSSSAIAEILGISGSSSNSPGPSSLDTTPLPDVSQSTTPVPETNHDLRTASTSVGDYFKEKLAARVLDRSKSSTPNLSAPHDESSDSKREDDGEIPRAGLGSRVTFNFSTANIDGEVPRTGLGSKFGGLMGGFVTSRSIPAPLSEEAKCDEQATEEKSKPKEKRKDTTTAMTDGEVTRNMETAETDDYRGEKKKRKEKRKPKEKKEKRVKKRTSLQEDAS